MELNEIAFALFCTTTIALVMIIGIAIEAKKTLDKCVDFTNFAWDMLHKEQANNVTNKPEISE